MERPVRKTSKHSCSGRAETRRGLERDVPPRHTRRQRRGDLEALDPPEQVVRLATLIGRRHPAYASAGGLAAMAVSFDESMLAAMPEKLSH